MQKKTFKDSNLKLKKNVHNFFGDCRGIASGIATTNGGGMWGGNGTLYGGVFISTFGGNGNAPT